MAMDQHEGENQSILRQFGWWLAGCCLLILFLGGMVCGLFFWLLWPENAGATSPTQSTDQEQPLAVWLLIDNSNSMFEMGGVGSDPDLLRLDAARLFLNYLGVDEPNVVPQAGVIFFGSTAVTSIPLTPLTTDEQRTQLFAQIAHPPQMGWTDPLAALELAQTQLVAIQEGHRPVIILLTDGKPEWTQHPSETQRADYMAALRAKGVELAEAGISFSVILLANEATAADAAIATMWQPLWQAMSAATPSGRFYVARTAAELPNIYHDLAVTLTGRQTAGMVLDTAVITTTKATLDVPSGLAQMTLVISKSSPTQTVTIQMADAVTMADGQPFVRQVGDNSREEIWIIENPQPGQWILQLAGQGHVTVWQDYRTTPPPTVLPLAHTAATAPILAPSPTRQLVTVVTAFPTATAARLAFLITAVPTKPEKEATTPHERNPPWPWLLFFAGLLVLGAGTAVFFRRPQSVHRPTVTGTLRLLGNNQTEEGYTVIDLDRLNRSRVVIGRSPADVPLPGALAQAEIRPGAAMAVETYEMRIKGQRGEGQNELWLKGRPLTGEGILFDMVVIDFGGGVRVRYENLRLRRAEREMQEIRN